MTPPKERAEATKASLGGFCGKQGTLLNQFDSAVEDQRGDYRIAVQQKFIDEVNTTYCILGRVQVYPTSPTAKTRSWTLLGEVSILC